MTVAKCNLDRADALLREVTADLAAHAKSAREHARLADVAHMDLDDAADLFRMFANIAYGILDRAERAHKIIGGAP